jgi:hypothetical protein
MFERWDADAYLPKLPMAIAYGKAAVLCVNVLQIRDAWIGYEDV